MDLVTLFAACAIGGQGLPSCPVDPSNSWHVVTIAEPKIDHWQPFIIESSRRFGIPEPWIRAVIRAESGGQTTLDGRSITSSAGAMGLMQVMPETYAKMRRLYGLGPDPYAPHDNVLAGVAYLRAMYDRYGYPNLFAAYNTGPEHFDDYILHGIPLPNETLNYLSSIQPDLRTAVLAEHPDAASRSFTKGPPTAKSTLFYPLGTGSIVAPNRSIPVVIQHVSAPDFHPSGSSSGGLFVPLSSQFNASGDHP